MTITTSIILGIIQGITEWLPVSSEGINTLIITQFLHMPLKDAVFLALWLHLGTLFSSLVYFRKDIKNIVIKKGPERNFIIFATIVSLVIAAPFILFGLEKINIQGPAVMAFIGGLLIITGILQHLSKKRIQKGTKITITDTIITGIAQGLAILPGLSRSGLTTSALLLRKHNAKTALSLSFILSIPAVAISSIWIFINNEIIINLASIIGIIASFVIGLLTISMLMKVTEKINFSWVCYILGVLALLSSFL